MSASKGSEKKVPLIRIAKRPDIPKLQAWLIRFTAVFLALISGGLLILVLGHNPLLVYRDMITGSLATKTALIATVKIAVPLLGAALSLAPAFRMKFWNIGTEGQILAGAIAASYFALFQYQNISRSVLLLLMFIASIAAGGVWGLIPAIFKAKWGTNETLFTLMLNYIILKMVTYLRTGPWKNPSSSGFPKIAMFDAQARLPNVFGVHIGWIIVLGIAVFMYIYMRYSKHGYEIAVVGESEHTARYVGMSVGKIIIRTILLSGAIAGMVGFLIVSGSSYTLTDNTAGGYGFTAITVAWLAKLNPFAMIIISAFLAILKKGSNTIQTNFKIPASASEVLTGIILFFMLGCEFFINYRLIFRGSNKGSVN
ncbi:MAG: ABC transporter permease [Acetivibrionales bacterium]|jgi:ABC-type uncharacterized transport system permease subunit